MTSKTLQPIDFAAPGVVPSGPVDHAMYLSFRDQLSQCPAEGLCVVELSTLGGDPEVARLMGEDVRYNSDPTQNAGSFSSVRLRSIRPELPS